MYENINNPSNFRASSFFKNYCPNWRCGEWWKRRVGEGKEWERNIHEEYNIILETQGLRERKRKRDEAAGYVFILLLLFPPTLI